MPHQPVTPGIGGDERAQFGILDHDLFYPGFATDDRIERLLAPRGFPFPNQPFLLLDHVLLYPLYHPVKRSLRRVRDKREHRVIEITVNGLYQARRQQLAQPFPFPVYIFVIPA